MAHTIQHLNNKLEEAGFQLAKARAWEHTLAARRARGPLTGPAPEPTVGSHEEWDEAIRKELRDLHNELVRVDPKVVEKRIVALASADIHHGVDIDYIDLFKQKRAGYQG